MKTLTLTNEEFDFLKRLFGAAYQNKQMLKDQMKESPTNKLFAHMNEMAGDVIQDPVAKKQFEDMKAKKQKDDLQMFEHLDSIHTKFTYVASSDQ